MIIIYKYIIHKITCKYIVINKVFYIASTSASLIIHLPIRSSIHNINSTFACNDKALPCG